MTQLDKKSHDAQIADMSNFDAQMPCIGIFWYDMEDKSFFGVEKSELTPKMVEEAAEKGLPFINYPKLHRQIWAKEFFRAQAKHEETKFKGRVGHWAEPIIDELTELIEIEFSLPYFEFVYDEHWDLGHGWSGDFK